MSNAEGKFVGPLFLGLKEYKRQVSPIVPQKLAKNIHTKFVHQVLNIRKELQTTKR